MTQEEKMAAWRAVPMEYEEFLDEAAEMTEEEKAAILRFVMGE